jgi:uncharacterized protein YukE
MKLNLLADVSKFGKGMNDAENSTKKLESKLKTNSSKMVRSIGRVVTAIGIMAIALSVDAAKAAADDEASQEKLRKNLENTAKVYDKKIIKSIENFIEKMQFASGFSDGELRDALGRLNVSTGDVSKSQDILNTALDTARGTGKPLATVVDTLAKAYDGNFTPLRKMGIKLDENIIATKDFRGVTEKLSDLFGGQASTYADTYQGKLDIVNQRLGELKEAAGAKILTPLGNLLEKVNEVAKGFAGETPESGLTGKIGMMQREMTNKKTGGYNLGESLALLAKSFGDLFSALNNDKDADTTLNNIAEALKNVADGINAIANAYRNAKKLGGKILDFIDVKGNPLEGIFDPSSSNYVFSKPPGMAAGGSVMGGQAYRVGEFGPETFVPSGSGSIRKDMGGNGVTIVMNGVIDGESARRSIERLLQTSARRTGAINLAGANL